jgi:hypothetical protein
MFRYATRLVSAVALMGSAAVAQAQVTPQPPTRLPASKVVGDSLKAVTVQNDRHTAVTLYLEAGRVDRALGTVPAGAVSTVELPSWALLGQRTVTVVARADGEPNAVATYTLPVNEQRRLGLLVPPSAGLPAGDSILVSVPKGIGSAATVTVDNARDQVVAVYAEQGLRFVKLGEVDPKQQATLPLPASMVESREAVRVFARPAGATERATQALRLKEGDRIAVIVM